jgi:acyl-coenzyme A thioesterase PaaI-like protein
VPSAAERQAQPHRRTMRGVNGNKTPRAAVSAAAPGSAGTLAVHRRQPPTHTTVGLDLVDVHGTSANGGCCMTLAEVCRTSREPNDKVHLPGPHGEL